MAKKLQIFVMLCRTNSTTSKLENQNFVTKRKEMKDMAWKLQNLIGTSDSISLEALRQIGSESEPPFRVLNQPAELPPSLKCFLRRVLGFHIPKVLIQVTFHRSHTLHLHQDQALLYIYRFFFNIYIHKHRNTGLVYLVQSQWNQRTTEKTELFDTEDRIPNLTFVRIKR